MKASNQMPRKKKGGYSPARVPSGLVEGTDNMSYRVPPRTSNSIPGSSLSTSAKEAIVRNMQEMFSHLDPEVIFIVLSECDFKVENAMDSLLELSVAASDPQPLSTSESGFERTAAALLSPHRFAEPSSQTDASARSQCSSPINVMTEDLDFLIDQEVLSLNTEENIEGQQLDSKFLSLTQGPFSNLEQCRETSIENSASINSVSKSGSSSPLDQLSTLQDFGMLSDVMNDLRTDPAVDKSKLPGDVLTSSYSSAFQLYSKPNDSNPGDASIKSRLPIENMDCSVPMSWNIKAPAFYPRIQENQCPAFITPVVSNITWEPRPTISWQRPIRQAQPRPSPTTPTAWSLPPPQPLGPNRLHLEGKVLVLLRGPPGSGKSTLARALLERNSGGVILSTDDYFTVNGQYHFDPAVLGEAHSWNHNRAKLAFKQGASPIIIDNTNMQGWEMRPYVVQALKHHYKVLFREPDTWWKNKPRELERRTKHGVPSERIRRMLCGYERFVTVKSILGSQMPERKQVAPEPGEKLVDCTKHDVADVVGDQNENMSQPNNESATSLRDGSTMNDSDCSIDNALNTDMDMGALDSELDKLDLGEIISATGAEAVNKDHCLDEIPVAFSESIGQRPKRERTGKNPAFELASKSEDESNIKEKDESVREEVPDKEGPNSEEVKMFEFEGDWPSTPLLDQRQGRRCERRNYRESSPAKAMGNTTGGTDQCTKMNDMPHQGIAELHKLLDLIQTGADQICTDLSPLSSISHSSEDELDISSQPPGRLLTNEELFVKEATTEQIPESVRLTLGKENDPDVELAVSENTPSIVQVCESPKCEHLGETDMLGSQELKQNHTRWSGKQCKLAMTFSQNCQEGSVEAPVQSAAIQMNDEVRTGRNPCNEKAEVCSSSFTQTESKDFAVLWRVNENSSNEATSSSHDFNILCCDPMCFVPSLAVDGYLNCKEIPYSVVHEKSTQVEDRELGPTQDLLENIHILRRHFKQVKLDTLEDLYEKCQHDLEWTTNLLLDSGERFFRDDESEEEKENSYTRGEDELAAGDGPNSSLIRTIKLENLSDSRPDVLVEEIEFSDNSGPEPYTNIERNSSDSNAPPGTLDDICSSLPQEKNLEKDNQTLEQLQETRTCLTSDDAEVEMTLQERGAEESEVGAYGRSMANIERAEGVSIEDDIRSINEVHRLLQAELEELKREEKEREEEKARRVTVKQKKTQLLDIKSVELKLPTELALQLTELFGPVGVDPDTALAEDSVVQMDLNLAKLLHQKWKETVQERQKQAALSFQLLQDCSSHWDKPQQRTATGRNSQSFQMQSGGIPRLYNHPDAASLLPLMDHWNVSQPHVSLRDIIKEEQVLHENRQKFRLTDSNKRDGATLLKEEQLFALFPTIDRHFLQDIFRDHNYSLTQTQLFLHSLLDEGPVKTVVAPEATRITQPRAASKDREKKSVNPDMLGYQDTQDPEYQDFRAEANLQRKRQLESFAKAAEAYKQGHKEVASFYAQQGHLHGQRMREANHRAAVQIFERVNSSLLPNNILDLHGLHVEEALEHLEHVLEQKTTECEGGLCRPQLSVITGRGNHSQGGVARIRPAVLDYLTNKQYRFTEPKPGLVLVSLN